jgi:putative colanic acid biosynthesis UDP-glucose lipid carrier transferase
MTINDIPVIAFFKRLLDPFIVWGMLVLVTRVYHEPFTGYYLILMIVTFFISSYVYEQTDIYRTWRNGKLLSYVRDTLVGWFFIIGILLFLGYASKLSYRYSDKVILTWFIVTPITLVSSHLAVSFIANNLRKRGKIRSVVIVGANDLGFKLLQTINDYPYMLMEAQGVFDDREYSRRPALHIPWLGGMSEVAGYVRKHNIEMIFISLPMSAQPRILRLLDELHDSTASIYFLPDVYIFDMMQARFDAVGNLPVVAICESPFSGVESVVKSFSDYVLATTLLILLSPLLLCIAVVIKFTSPGPVIFKQHRYGLNGERIMVYKFRTMTVCENGPHIVQAKKDDQRITKVGVFLRRTSLDELPQLINVLQGRMSIVGPRPHAVAHNELYRGLIRGYMLRHKVKPGITGWAQVNGLRGETQELSRMQARIEADLYYLRNWSIWLDMWIMVRTLLAVARRDNAY